LVLATNVISENDQIQIFKELEEEHGNKWKESQSGRIKMDFGPRVNFKKQQIRWPPEGVQFPRFLNEFLLYRLKNVFSDYLKTKETWTPAEMVVLRYQVSRSANIALHKDDLWVWGERIVGVNLCNKNFFKNTEIKPEFEVNKNVSDICYYGSADCVNLEVDPKFSDSFTAFDNPKKIENSLVDDDSNYRRLSDDLTVSSNNSTKIGNGSIVNTEAPKAVTSGAWMLFSNPDLETAIEVFLPPLSCYLISGESRSKWSHGIRAGQVEGVERVSITLREIKNL
jgi:hypothetical protein